MEQEQQERVYTSPYMDLIEGARERYLTIGVRLYNASITCNWKEAEAILKEDPELVRYSITEFGETPLHIAASAKGDPKSVQEEFVKELVDIMEKEDLELVNRNYNTALYLAVVAGNVETVKIMVEKNKKLLTIPGANGNMMPLYAAVVFGNEDVAEYIYEKSKSLSNEEGWNDKTRSWLLEKCVDSDMFELVTEPGVSPEAASLFLRSRDMALNIIKEHPDTDTREVLGLLAGKPKAFLERKTGIMVTIKSVFAFICCRCLLRSPKKESNNALPLLKCVWNEILKKPKRKIDEILRGPKDEQDNMTFCGWAVQVLQLRKVIDEHVKRLNNAHIYLISRVSQEPDLSKAKILEDLISQSLVKLHVETQHIMKASINLTTKDIKYVSEKGILALELQKLIFKNIKALYDRTFQITNMNTDEMEDQLLDLHEVISKHTKAMQKGTREKVKEYKKAMNPEEAINPEEGMNTEEAMNPEEDTEDLEAINQEKRIYSSRVLFIAAKVGNTNFLVELIRQYPDLIWKVDDNNQSIFHIATKHRHEGVYNMLYEIGSMKDMITPLKDSKNNTMLHLVGKIAEETRLNDVSGVALQMQLELLWFQEVREMMPPSYRERRNDDGLTAHELFTMEHKDLLTQGEKWMKGTSSQCMVVAALIATIVFAATFTVPGGYDQNNGIPVFHSKATFVVFVVADAISLISSAASILMFLSILTSRYAEHDFLRSLPTKLVLGLAALFLSITTMMIAFGVSFFVLYHKGLVWIPILICTFVMFPTFLYIGLQYDLFFDVYRSTYHSTYLFKPKKHLLYYENPKV